MRPTLLLLISLGLATAAPTPPAAPSPPHYQEEARAFFGKVANLLAKHQFVDLYDLVAAKAEDLLPGILGDGRAALRETIAQYIVAADQGSKVLLYLQMHDQLSTQLGVYQKKAEVELSKDAFAFLEQSFLKINSPSTRLGQLSAEMVDFRARYTALPQETKDSLLKACPIFGRLQEVQAYVKVIDAIARNSKQMCEELPGFEQCDRMMKLL